MFYRLVKASFQFFYCKVYEHTTLGYKVFDTLETGAIIASNHLSYFDPPLLGISCPRPLYFLAKKELFSSFFLNWIMKSLNALPIEGKLCDKDSLKEAIRVLENKGYLAVFPEGARSQSGKIASFQKGVGMLAYKLGCPIIPAYIKGTYEIWPPHKTFPKLFKKSLVAFGEPIYFQKELKPLNRKKQIAAITLQVEQAVRKLEKEHGKSV